MLYPTAYETIAAKGYVTKNIELAIQRALITGQVRSEGDIIIVEQGTEIAPFNHPLLVEYDKRKYIAIDVRTMVSALDHFNIKVSNKAAYELLLKRAKLNNIWVNHSPSYLMNITDQVMVTYAKWISENITKRFALNPRDQAIIEVLAATFFLSLFSNAESATWEEENKILTLNKLSRNFRYGSDLLSQVVMGINKPMESLDDLVSQIKQTSDNVRLKDFSTPILLTLISRTWFGHNAPELLAVALEHPPTFIAIFHTALAERIFRNTGFAKTAEKTVGKNVKQVVSNIDNLINASDTL